MMPRHRAALAAALGSALLLFAPGGAMGQPDFFKKGPPFGGPGGPGGFGQIRKILAKFDKDGDGRLNAAERKAAREWLKEQGGGGVGKGPPMMGKGRRAGKPGPKVAVSDVKPVPKSVPLYDPGTLRVFFLEFENKDWEAELADFYHTDVEVPARLTVDGKVYRDVGVRFRGMSSYFSVPAGLKRSLNLTIDFVHKKQRVLGHKTLNLLNCNDDPSFLHTALYSHVARSYIPTPRANLAKVVINGESWGIYTNVEQFNKDFLGHFFGDKAGTRWKVQGSPGGRGGLEYMGEDTDNYRNIFRVKGKDDPKAWDALVKLCYTLNGAPEEKLEAALSPMLDIEGALWFLALDVGLINNDGYWTRASDYSLYRDSKKVFHLIPHDMNECFGPVEGGPFGGGGGRGVDLHPYVATTNSRMPLRSKLLAVPYLRARYLEMLRRIAAVDLDWDNIGPVVAGYRKLIEKEVEIDSRKLYTLAEFKMFTGDRAVSEGREMSLRAFCEQRRKYLLEHPTIKQLSE
jgi:hypothetical protein